MNKAKVIGLTVTVLAVIGGVAVYNWVKKPKRNADGFFNASGGQKGRDGSALHEGTTGMGSGTGGRG